MILMAGFLALGLSGAIMRRSCLSTQSDPATSCGALAATRPWLNDSQLTLHALHYHTALFNEVCSSTNTALRFI